jgi:hypothetical protein
MRLRNASSFLAAGVLVAASVFSGSANAAIVILNVQDQGSALPGAPLPAASNIFYENFDNAPLGSGVYNGVGGLTLTTVPNAAVVTGTSDQAAAPFVDGTNNLYFGPVYTGPDNTRYVAAGATSTNPAAVATLSFTAAQQYLGLLWGSVDIFNTLSFFNGATLVGTITGQNLADLGFPAGGLRNPQGTVYVNIVATGGTTFNRVEARSTINTFEFDNVAFSVVPEPTSAVLALAGGGLFFLRFRRKKAAVVA